MNLRTTLVLIALAAKGASADCSAGRRLDGEDSLPSDDGDLIELGLLQRRASKSFAHQLDGFNGSGSVTRPQGLVNGTGIAWQRKQKLLEKAERKLAPSLLMGLISEEKSSWKSWAVLTVMLLALLMLFLETHASFVPFLVALVVVWNLGVLSTHEAISGFSDSSVVIVGALSIVMNAVDRSRAVDTVARACLGDKTSQPVALLRFCSTAMLGASVTNGVPLVALLMPTLRDWARIHSLPSSKFLMPLAFSAGMAGLMTLTGTVTNLVINGMVEKSTGEKFGYIDVAWVGIPLNILGMIYLVLYAPRLLPENQDGLLQMLEDKKDSVITELQVSMDFPLLGSSIKESLEELGIPREALVKVFRQQALAATLSHSNMSLLQGVRSFSRSTTEDQGSTKNRWGDLSALKSGIGRASSDLCIQSDDRDADQSAASPKADQPAKIREIFPVTEDEILMGGDVLLLSLPKRMCLALVQSEQLREKLASLQEIPAPCDEPGAKDRAVGEGTSAEAVLRICNIDVAELSGRDHEFVEVVVSKSNQFVGADFRGPERLAFEKHYQAAVLAVQHQGSEPSTQFDVLSPQLAKSASTRDLVADAIEPSNPPGGGSSPEHVESHSQHLRPGDTLLLLASSRDVHERLDGSDEFLAMTLLDRKANHVAPHWSDYLPLILFIGAVVLVALGRVSMVQAVVSLAGIYLLLGWVDASGLREIVDWNTLVLIGSSLGLAQAFQNSGLSSEIAGVLKVLSGEGSIWVTIWLLYLVTLILTELVGSNPAATLAMPLALELTKEHNLDSAKPLAMVVMLAASSAFALPAMNTPCLMVMGPGGYTFGDFLRVGLPLDLIYLIAGSLLLPLIWPMRAL
eukprot:TRINITY_DN88649_c0_g1_i1.p1 TRINITY_DN88649_c0_g1~~TRINITY_DN88649_c0_g1_i1.p1  ORF type:complete len:857 (-),score=155.38 TRINITY_DN88649_c0_g1_i1:406-2976(-)